MPTVNVRKFITPEKVILLSLFIPDLLIQGRFTHMANMPAFIQKIWVYLSTNWSEAKQPAQRSKPKSPNPTVLTNVKTSLPDTLQQDIRAQRKFSIAEAIGREGGSFMKGESTIPRPLRATTEINQFILTHVSDPASVFSTTLQTWASSDIRVSRQLDTPLIALAQIIASLLSEPTTFYEFARQVAIAQSNLTGDRPHFQQPDQPPHPEASYTHDSLKAELNDLQRHLLPKESPESLP